MEKTANAKIIAKNTLMLYFRQILIMFVSLYTVRIVLNVLGAEDYGIYNVVAGVVTLFSFISGTMANGSQRYFSYDLGKNDIEHLEKTFSITMQIYLLLIVLTLVLGESVGLWFVKHKLVIPQERLTAAIWVYQFAILSFIVSLVTAPYMALIIAHEKMNIYAYVSLIEAGLKIGLVVLLKFIDFDKLILYSVLLFFISVIITALYRFYCRRNYKESKLKIVWDFVYLREIVSYSGWNLFGALAYVIKTQGVNILLNLHFGAVVNAAKGVATQVENAVVSFANNFSTAVNPQIIKSYATGNTEESLRIVYRGSKCTFFLVYVFALPLVLEMPFVMNLWLGTPPDYVILFTRLTLLDALLESINNPSKVLAQATGKIKVYQIVVGGTKILLLPLCVLGFMFGFSAYSVYLISIFITFVSSLLRYVIISKITFFPIGSFIKNVYLPCFIVAFAAGILPVIVCLFMSESVIRFLLVSFLSVVLSIVCAYFIGLNKEEQDIIREKFLKRFKK